MWVAGLMLAAVVFSIIWGRQTPITVVESRLVPEAVVPGENIRLDRTIRRTRPDCGVPTLTVMLVDSHRLIKQLQPIKAPDGVSPLYGTVSSSWMIPETMPAGTSLFKSKATFSCYPFYDWWPLEVDLPDLTFYVVSQPAFQPQSLPSRSWRPN